MRVLGIIPARGGSKGIPRKNLKILGDKPLLAYTIDSALASIELDRVIFSSEDDELIDLARGLGVDVPFTRPADLAMDDTPSIDVVIHVLNELEERGEEYDAICLLQVTNPFRPDGFIDSAIRKFRTSGMEALISVLPVPDEFNPYWTFLQDDSGGLRKAIPQDTIIPRRQELPVSYYRDGSIYLSDVALIRKHRTFFREELAFIEADPKFHVNIDTPADWQIAEDLLLRLK